ncbi:DUF4159 domain-containing protein [Magnetospirillum sp. SS-4]|uniref:DUF4159 domain-containing protein n=1 Tax=Magnetospirillum sp. SS-4 TaxID=2681465 RepID=UPI0013829F5B|nr:DUF4159 domain-containing protein [Magnetospirillum sp. SS-4]CAA7615899.1 conserved hypothetical protein [Magnetospirillum sp. SS-4]
MTPFLPGLVFAAPWALGLLPLLPLLWRLLRVTPPAPRRLRFPAIRLLLGLSGREQQAEATPPWLLALRLALAACLILAAAGPVVNSTPVAGHADGAMLVVVDDGWAAARDWPERIAALDILLTEAQRAARPVLLLTTAPPSDGSPVAVSRLGPSAGLRSVLAGLSPRPWAVDRKAAAAALARLSGERVGRTVWLSDGLHDEGAAELARTLQGLGGGLELMTGRTGRQLLPPAEDSPSERLAVQVRRLIAALPETLAVRGLDASGTVLVREEVTLEAGAAEATVVLALPSDLRNRLVRLDIEGERSAAAVVLLDERWRRRAVGLADGGRSAAAALLDPLHYVERALAPHADLRRGDLDGLLAEDGPEVLILADRPLPPGPLAERLAAGIHQGRVLIRFAGPLLAEAAAGRDGAGDALLPVPLRGGGRALGGAMSWTAPMALAPFPDHGPLSGLAIPADVAVRSQLLAEPGLDLAAHSWATLSDGTPLITARRHGKGWIVLVHTTGNAEWSNLALSGLFVDMLRRLAGLARGGRGGAAAGPLAPLEVLDGFGQAHPAAGGIAALTVAESPRPGPRHPPGLYGTGEARLAFNLGPALAPPRPLDPPPGAILSGLEGRRAGLDLGPGLLAAALLLAVADALASLWLRGALFRRAGTVAALLLALPVSPAGAGAADSFALDAGLSTRLACIRTGQPALDRDCLAGLRGLSAAVGRRSTAQLAEPVTVDAERDPVVFFPLLYWRVGPLQPPLPAAAVERLNAYMARGGLIVVDAGDDNDDAGRARLRELTRGLVLPPLEPLAADHVLNRSFYLLKESPGRWDAPPPWVERPNGGGGNDDVSPVVVGNADWVGAWAVDEYGRPLHAVVPGGERQREISLRFGVNLVMYALTGNYKADQVHLPAILERVGR